MKSHVHRFIKKEVPYKVMEFHKLTAVFQDLEKTTKRLEMTRILKDFLKKVPSDLLLEVTLLATGKIFPEYSQKEIGFASGLMIKAIVRATGFTKKEIESLARKHGDLGAACEAALKKKRQRTLSVKKLTVKKVVENLIKCSELEGPGTVNKKVSLVTELITSASPKDSKYVVRLTLGQLRIGIGEGTVRDAIASAFDVDKKDVEQAWFLSPHYGRIAQIAKKSGKRGLSSMKISVGEPVKMQLAERSPDLGTALESAKNPALEYKYDGARVQIHKKGDKIWVYTRRLEDVTKQFPEIEKWAKKALKPRECIVEGEVVAIDSKGRPLPFQKLSQRIQRKYDIEQMIKKIPLEVKLFEITYLNGKLLFKTPLEKRWASLKKILKPIRGKFELANHIETKNETKAEKFFKQALKEGHEGIIIKNLNADYQPGRRVGYWWKVKSVAETIDLTVIRAVYGTGKRAGALASFVLACRHKDKYLECGMMGTGIKEKGEEMTFKKMTKILKPYFTKEKGNTVWIKPKIIIEVGYEEIQKSPTYNSGFALRFPRFIRDRSSEKSLNDVDTLERIKYLYKIQKGKKK